MHELDPADKRILNALRRNARMSWVELSERVNLSASSCQRRVEAMQRNGIIKAFTLDLDSHKMGQTVRALINVKVERQRLEVADGFRRTITGYSEVRAFYKLSGSIDYLISIAVADIQALSRFIDYKLLSLDGVVDASSAIILEDMPCETLIL